MQGTSDKSIGLLPRADFDWPVSVESDNARISRRISARRSGGSGKTLINVIDAAELRLCLLFRSFLVAKDEISILTCNAHAGRQISRLTRARG